MKNLFFILLFFLATNKMYSQTIAPLLANDTFKLEACARGPETNGTISINCIPAIQLNPENSGYIQLCNFNDLTNVPNILFKSISTTGTAASFRIVNLSASATIKISITSVGQATQTVSIAPNSKSEIIHAPAIKTITAMISCTNRPNMLNEKAIGLFQWIK